MKRILTMAALLICLTTEAQVVKGVTTTSITVIATPDVDYVTPSKLNAYWDSTIMTAKIIAAIQAIPAAQATKTLSVVWPLALDTSVPGTAKIYLSQITQTITAAGSFSITQGTNKVSIDPATSLGAVTINLPTNYVDGYNLTITAGGKIINGASVAVAFLLIPASGQKLYGTIPLTLKGGDSIILNYEASTNSFKRI